MPPLKLRLPKCALSWTKNACSRSSPDWWKKNLGGVLGSKRDWQVPPLQSSVAVIVEDLVAADLADGEVFRLRVGEVQSADTRAGPHGAAFGQLDAGVLFRVEQLPEGPFLRVVGASGVAGGGADAAILSPNHLFHG